ncbi:organic cation transporter protein-like [Homarus americanus]|uniref:organic cation transporter protein-like n=1 Tax=Homarus americanus TaxID=6706 RepID=UPI001C45DBC8|nr:organic cation transporter protein-like [Homarus americanus]
MEEEREEKETEVQNNEEEVKKQQEDVLKTDDDLGNVKTFEDLLQVVGTRGRWNLLLFLVCAYATYVPAHQTLSYQFLGATPDYWCHIAPLVEANWTQEQVLNFAIPTNKETGKFEHCLQYNYTYSKVAALGYEGAVNAGLVPLPNNTPMVSCASRDFNLTQYESTLTIEWDLVCERRVLYSTTQAAVQVGKLVGYLFHGFLLDRYGRRPVVLWSALFTVVAGFLAASSPNVELYICLLIVILCMTSGCYLGCFILQMETCSTKERSMVGTLFVVPWALGYMVVPGIAYLVRRWRELQAVVTVPALVFIAHYWLLPVLAGSLCEVNNTQGLPLGFKINRKTLPPDHVLLAAMKKIRSLDVREEEKQEQQASLPTRALKFVKQFTSLLRVKALRKKILIVFFCWFASSMIYYGIALNATNLSANVYLYIFLGGLLEMPSYLLLWPAVVYLGRVRSLSSLYFMCAVCIFSLSVCIIFTSDVPVGVMMFLSLTGKVAITAAFHLIWMMTAELFPTKYRSLALSHSSVTSRCGSILSPYINDILGEVIMWAPSMVFGLTSLVAGGLCLFLPETRDRSLTEDIKFEDSQQLGSQSDVCTRETLERQNNETAGGPSGERTDTSDNKTPQDGKTNPAYTQEAEENNKQANTNL